MVAVELMLKHIDLIIERFMQPRFKIVGLDFILDPIGAPVKAAFAPSAQVQHGFAQGF